MNNDIRYFHSDFDSDTCSDSEHSYSEDQWCTITILNINNYDNYVDFLLSLTPVNGNKCSVSEVFIKIYKNKFISDNIKNFLIQNHKLLTSVIFYDNSNKKQIGKIGTNLNADEDYGFFEDIYKNELCEIVYWAQQINEDKLINENKFLKYIHTNILLDNDCDNFLTIDEVK